MSGYQTHVVGKEAWYSKEAIEAWKLNYYIEPPYSTWLWYRSNWRIMHIDGFEPGYGSRTIHFEFKLSSGMH